MTKQETDQAIGQDIEQLRDAKTRLKDLESRRDLYIKNMHKAERYLQPDISAERGFNGESLFLDHEKIEWPAVKDIAEITDKIQEAQSIVAHLSDKYKDLLER